MKAKVDFNADMAESYRGSRIGSDKELVMPVSSASLARGLHGGDPLTMMTSIEMCKANGVGVGAHPSFPNREGFGRKEMEMPSVEMEAGVLYQVPALRSFP